MFRALKNMLESQVMSGANSVVCECGAAADESSGSGPPGVVEAARKGTDPPSPSAERPCMPRTVLEIPERQSAKHRSPQGESLAAGSYARPKILPLDVATGLRLAVVWRFWPLWPAFPPPQLPAPQMTPSALCAERAKIAQRQQRPAGSFAASEDGEEAEIPQ
ncbi:hypothetical protein HPB47_006921 [Ixodes persulcatus]|uniref:Uncharacterized protein n=1 Tax=Ixodes persulcatus TaxID=34615 RepID=A0AC60P8Q6_IXOPE|nr:hypothetical protein HPB47_006921 [Ixodes persulcatus]